MTHKWDCPHHWLRDHVGHLWEGKRIGEIVLVLHRVADEMDDDTLQFIFEDEMDADGYFKEQQEEQCTECDDPECPGLVHCAECGLYEHGAGAATQMEDHGMCHACMVEPGWYLFGEPGDNHETQRC